MVNGNILYESKSWIVVKSKNKLGTFLNVVLLKWTDEIRYAED